MGRVERTPPGFKINKPLSKDRGFFYFQAGTRNEVLGTRDEVPGKAAVFKYHTLSRKGRDFLCHY